jgi:ferredoxin-type protein NapH
MASKAQVLHAQRMVPRSIGRSLLLTLPIMLWSLLMFTSSFRQPNRSTQFAGVLTAIFLVTLFFLMMRTRSTYRWRRLFFVALGILFPVGFIHTVISMRGTMGIPIE